MAKRFEFRFGVRDSDGYESFVWRVWTTKSGDVYLTQRTAAGKVEKFSFHVRGICRWAFHVAPAGMSDRVLRGCEWWRRPTPARGEFQGSCVARIAFPTSFLSLLAQDKKKAITWIDAAPKEKAAIVDLFFTREAEQTVKELFANDGQRRLIAYAPLFDDEAFAVAYYYSDWQDRELKMPGKGEVHDLLFSPNDPFSTGRPVRICLPVDFRNPTPRDGDAFFLQELGGYPVQRT